MKELIDIPDYLYKLLKDFPSDSNETTIENVLMKAVENGTPIPDNATNGDIVQMMFPNASFFYHKANDIVDDYVSVCIDDCDTQQDYSMVWWNATYQKGGK